VVRAPVLGALLGGEKAKPTKAAVLYQRAYDVAEKNVSTNNPMLQSIWQKPTLPCSTPYEPDERGGRQYSKNFQWL